MSERWLNTLLEETRAGNAEKALSESRLVVSVQTPAHTSLKWEQRYWLQAGEVFVPASAGRGYSTSQQWNQASSIFMWLSAFHSPDCAEVINIWILPTCPSSTTPSPSENAKSRLLIGGFLAIIFFVASHFWLCPDRQYSVILLICLFIYSFVCLYFQFHSAYSTELQVHYRLIGCGMLMLLGSGCSSLKHIMVIAVTKFYRVLLIWLIRQHNKNLLYKCMMKHEILTPVFYPIQRDPLCEKEKRAMDAQ